MQEEKEINAEGKDVGLTQNFWKVIQKKKSNSLLCTWCNRSNSVETEFLSSQILSHQECVYVFKYEKRKQKKKKNGGREI